MISCSHFCAFSFCLYCSSLFPYCLMYVCRGVRMWMRVTHWVQLRCWLRHTPGMTTRCGSSSSMAQTYVRF